MALIEMISYFVRPLSHSVRLAGNMMAGHAVLKVFAGFASCASQPDDWHQYGPADAVHTVGDSFVISPGFWATNALPQ